MGYTALYRKFRPDSFADVKGQDHIVKTLKNQISADRIGHAYLFCGTRGTGKTSVAKIFAKAVNCEHPVDGNPCNECATCRAIAAGASMNVIEIDAASNNGVDNIREIREEVTYRPTEGRYKVYIIDEVHMLSMGAFNALLKTLEEPPSYVIFILATTEAHKIPVTILSRCQRYDFRRIAQDTILSRLQELMETEHVDAEERALRYIAKKGDGSLRDSLSLLDQCIAFYLGETLTYDRVLEVLGAVDTEVFSDLLRKILKEDLVSAISTLEQLIMQGRDLTQFVNDFTWYMRNLMLLKASDDMEDVLDVSTENLIQLREEAAMIRSDTLMRFLRIFSELANNIRYATNKRVLLELALIKLCRPEAEKDELSVLERVRRLERRMEQGYVPAGMAMQSAPGTGMPQTGVSSEGAGNEPYGTQGMAGNAAAQGVPGGQIEGYPEPPAQYPKAAPEDLQKVRSMWKSIVGETSGMFRVVLSAAVPKFNASDANDNRLYVVFADFLAERYLTNEEKKQELQQIIAERTGRQVEVKFTLAADEDIQRGHLSSIEIEEIIHDNIHMDIEYEE
jgi:DNA polymerase-3 subunit gamma/tau